MDRSHTFITSKYLVLAVWCVFGSLVSSHVSAAGFAVEAGKPVVCQGSDYYRYGSVQAKVNQRLAEVEVGKVLSFGGVLENHGKFPIAEATLYVKIVQVKKSPEVQRNGYNVIDQFIAAEGVPIDASSSVPVTFTWQVPNGLASGEYRALYYVALKRDMDISGLNFADDIVGNQSSFKVVNKDKKAMPAYFSKGEVTLNGKLYEFARPQLEFKAGEAVTLKAFIVNPLPKEVMGKVTYRITNWSPILGTGEEMSETVTLKPKGKTAIEKIFTSRGYPAPFVLVTFEGPDGVKSQLDVRYSDIKKGVRPYYLGLSSFPVQENVSLEAYVCFHALNETNYASGVTVTTKGYDRSGKEVFSQSQETKALSGPRDGLAYAFTAPRDITYLKLESSITADGVTYKNETTYDCLIKNNCPALKQKGTDLYKKSKQEARGVNIAVYVGVGVALLLVVLCVVSIIFLGRKKGVVVDLPQGDTKKSDTQS